MLLGLILAACVAACSSLPRDPRRTLQNVRGGRVRVGLIEHPPWVMRTEGEPAGAEVELVRWFASELQATPEWHWGGEQQHMEALEQYELELVIGGLTAKSPWARSVGLTSPYFVDRILVGFPGSMRPVKEIEGAQVAVRPGEPAAAYLERQHAIALRVDKPEQTGAPAAASEWELELWGYTPGGVELLAEQHVMAVPPGENGWLKALEEFLYRHHPQVKNLLQQQEARR